MAPEEDDIEYKVEPDAEALKRVIKTEILHKLDIGILSSIRCLVNEDREKIEEEIFNNEDTIRAASTFCTILVKKNDWWNQLIEKLRESNVSSENQHDQSKIADLLEEALKKVKQEKQPAAANEGANEQGLVQETTDDTVKDENVAATASKETEPMQCEQEGAAADDLAEAEPACKVPRLSADDTITDSRERQENSFEHAITPVNTASGGLSDQSKPGTSGADPNADDLTDAMSRLELVKTEKCGFRKYQEELAEPAVKGKNTMICSPTGSGKTYVAAIVMEHHFRKGLPRSDDNGDPVIDVKRPKVLYVVPVQNLVDQTQRKLLSLLPLHEMGKKKGSSTTKLHLKGMLTLYDVVVVTPDILKNDLLSKSTTFEDFTLLILDECHKTKDNHAYNKIMQEFIKHKIGGSSTRLPQIVAFTASPGAGTKLNKEKAVLHVEGLCANLDVEVLKTVQRNRAELEQFVSTPTKSRVQAKKRQGDPVTDKILTMMGVLETIGFGHELGLSRHAPQYLSLLDIRFQEAADYPERRKICELLKEYHQALLHTSLLRMRDGYDVLIKAHEELERRNGPNGEGKLSPTEKSVLKVLTDAQAYLAEKSELEDDHPNPFLVELKEVLLDERPSGFRNNSKSRGVVYVETRRMAEGLKQYLEVDPHIRALELHPLIATGHQGSMNFSQVTENLARFRDGSCRLLISTAVTVEGMDIAECNLVVRYHFVKDAVAAVQSRGRARDYDSREVVIGSAETLEREVFNQEMETNMIEAIKSVQKMMEEPTRFREQILKQQKGMIGKLKRDEQRQKKTSSRFQARDVKLCCKSNHHFLCTAEDIRVMDETDRVFYNLEWDKVTVKDHHKEEMKKQGIKKIHCVVCDSDVGNTRGGFPCLSIKKIRIKCPTGWENVGKWSNLPCPVADME